MIIQLQGKIITREITISPEQRAAQWRLKEAGNVLLAKQLERKNA